MKNLTALTPRAAVLDGTADFVVNLADMDSLTEEQAREFLETNVLTAGMELLLAQTFARMAGRAGGIGIYKLSESMGGGKTQAMIVAGILAKFPHLVVLLPFRTPLDMAEPDVVCAFSGRSTHQKVWVALGEALGVAFAPDRAPSETEWRDAIGERTVLFLLDEMAFYLTHAASQGSVDQGTRSATLAGIALTNLFGAVRDHVQCRRSVIIVADLQKDWEQGGEELARIMRTVDSLDGLMRSVNNEMTKGAQTISPVDNAKDELYAILRRRLFKDVNVTPREIEEIADGHVAELKKASAVIVRPVMQIREEILVSYLFHFSTKRLIATFNDNPGFQKTRDVIRLMATIVRGLWDKGESEVARQTLLSLETADLNDPNVASRFVEIKKSLQDAIQTDVAASGRTHAESLDPETDGLASRCARWILAASLSDIRPMGLNLSELAEYMVGPGRSILGLQDTLKKLFDSCWYIEQTKSGRYYFHRHKNLNAQINSYVNICTTMDRDATIASKLTEMFTPKDMRCYQKLEVMPRLEQVHLERDRTTLIILKPETDFRQFFADQKYKNRVAFLLAVESSGMFNVNKRAVRLWAVGQVIKDNGPEDGQHQKAVNTQAEYQTELFLALKSVFSKLYYPLWVDEGETELTGTTLLDGYIDRATGHHVKYRNEEASKGEFVIEATLREAGKYVEIVPAPDMDKVKAYQSLRTRVEQFLFPATGLTTWEQIRDGAATRGHMLWTVPGALDRMREVLVESGTWREEAGQIQKPPFDEYTSVFIEYARDKKSGAITTTDIRLSHADKLLVREDAGEWKTHPVDAPLTSPSMLIEFKAVDSTGKSREGRSFRIENEIELYHDILPSPNPDHHVVKVRVVPAAARVRYSLDERDPANHGLTYDPQTGIEAEDGSKVRLHAEQGGKSKSATISIPRQHAPDSPDQGVNPDLPATVLGKTFSHLITRAETYAFLSKLPAGTTLRMVQAKVVAAASGNDVTLTWDRKTSLEPHRVMDAFTFLDTQIQGGEWVLRFDQLLFAVGRDLLQWQVDTDSRIDLSQVSQ